VTSTTSTLTDRILTVLASPEWQAEPPGSRAIAEVLREPRRDVIAALGVLETEGKITDLGGSPYVARAGWVIASPTTTPDPYDVNNLRDTVPGTARIVAEGRLTVGVHADGSQAGWGLRRGYNLACHTTIFGDTGSGKSTLLRSILAAATAAGIDAQVIDPNGMIGDTGHPTASGPNDAHAVLAEQHQLALTRMADARRDRPAPGTRPIRLLVIDDLQDLAFDDQAAEHLRELVRHDAGAAGIALVIATQPGRLRYFDAVMRQSLLSSAPVLLRIRSRNNAIQVSPALHEPIPAGLPGVGYLPHRYDSLPFRAWFPPTDTP
jgi:AAA domain